MIASNDIPVADIMTAEQLERVAMPSVYKALNALQDTEWRINGPVYRLVVAIRNRGAS